jgi:hypothetical protein
MKEEAGDWIRRISERPPQSDHDTRARIAAIYADSHLSIARVDLRVTAAFGVDAPPDFAARP